MGFGYIFFLSNAQKKTFTPIPEKNKALPIKLLLKPSLMSFNILTHLHNEDENRHLQSNLSGQTWATG